MVGDVASFTEYINAAMRECSEACLKAKEMAHASALGLPCGRGFDSLIVEEDIIIHPLYILLFLDYVCLVKQSRRRCRWRLGWRSC